MTTPYTARESISQRPSGSIPKRLHRSEAVARAAQRSVSYANKSGK